MQDSSASTSIPQTKRRLRRQFRDARRMLSARDQQAHAQSVVRYARSSGLWYFNTLAGYMAADGELSLHLLIAKALADGKRIVLPVIRETRLEFYLQRAHDRFVLNNYGISEPAPGAAHVSIHAVSVLFMPLVAFDDTGVRLGMGGGYYDRTLARCPPGLRPKLIGIAHEVQHSSMPLPREAWDLTLDAVLTERGLHHFKPGKF